jgi:hypothetical protein
MKMSDQVSKSVLREWIFEDISTEVIQAEENFPEWPNDIIHGVAIMAEESGEAVRAALQHVYEGAPVEELSTELIQTAAMCVRMLLDLEKQRGEKEKSDETDAPDLLERCQALEKLIQETIIHCRVKNRSVNCQNCPVHDTCWNKDSNEIVFDAEATGHEAG